jgi:TRAP-type C4-dicarboxylate transport system permease large subunit
MKKIFAAMLVVLAALNVVACRTHAAVDGSGAAAASQEGAMATDTQAKEGMRK